jgi:hypothetical protein
MHTARWLTALCLVFACHAGALAQPQGEPGDKKRNEASAHFRRGVELFQEEAYRAALVEFERAYALVPDYRLHYNIGQTKLRLQDYLGVVQSYERYLTVGGTAVPVDRRTQVEDALVALRDRVGRIGITCNRAGAEIFVDDLSVGKTPLPATIPVNVGRHRVLARTADGANDSKMVDVAGGDVAEVSFELEPPRRLASGGSSLEENRWSLKKKAAVGSWSAGGLLLAAGAVTGALTFGSQSDLDKMVETEGVKPKSVQSKSDSLEMLALSTDVLIATGAVAVVIGTVLWLVDQKSKKKDKATPTDRRAGVGGLRVALGTGTALLSGSF